MTEQSNSEDSQKARLTASHEAWAAAVASMPSVPGVDVDRLTADSLALVSAKKASCASINAQSHAFSAYALHLTIEGILRHHGEPEVRQAYLDLADAYTAHSRNLAAEYALCLVNSMGPTLPS